ncbi:FAD-binding oxidoreductase [Streptomyces sp. NBC_00631]
MSNVVRAMLSSSEEDGLLAAAYSPDDGHCSPESVVLGYATAARRYGAHLETHCEVLGIDTLGGEVRAVRTSRGTIATSTVVCAAGAWSAAVGDMVGTTLPVVPYQRQIVFTEPYAPELPAPMTIDFSSAFHFRREGRGFLLGMSDPDEPPGFRLKPSETWLPRLTEVLTRRVPKLLDAGLAGGWTGLYEITPDHNALIGEATDMGRFLYACGFSGHGFLQAPAVGEVVRDLVLNRQPFVDITPLNVGRFTGERLRIEANYV